MRKLTVAFEVAGILMHRNMDDTVKYRKDFVIRLESLFKLQVFVPKWMRQEVKANAAGTSLEQPIRDKI